MRLFEIPSEQGMLALRALKTVALADGALSELERELLVVAAQLYGVSMDELELEALAPIDPPELEGQIAEEQDRHRLLQACMTCAMADGEASQAEYEALLALRQALAIGDQETRLFKKLVQGAVVRTRIALTRAAMQDIKPIAKELGFSGLAKMLLFGSPYRTEDKALADKYRRLGLLPKGTVGREYWIALRSKGFGFPGEVGALPEPAARHDLCHLLTGYDTDPRGELLVLAFTAGMRGEDSFHMICMGMVNFHLGMKVQAVAEPTTGLFEPAAFARAIERGAAMTIDLLDPAWDVWSIMDRDMDEVRSAINLLPV